MRNHILFLIASTFAILPSEQALSQFTGIDTPGMRVYDSLIPHLMRQWNVPGGVVAVVKDGSLIFVHGYGTADSSLGLMPQPYSRMRVASLSKAITSMTILKLYEEGKLHLDDKVFSILNQFAPFDTTNVDKRIYDITIRELLQHTGGWDRDLSGDPMFESLAIAEATNTTPPADKTTTIRYMMGQPLDHDPGTVYAYSNFGYMLLGRVIEKLTGQDYDVYVKQLLAQAGITRIVQGRTLPGDAQPDEVHYYDYPGHGLATDVFTGVPNAVPWPYGGFYLEDHDANGGWISSAIDYLRFMTADDGRASRPDILKLATIDTMVSRPFQPVAKPTDQYYYGMGWGVTRLANGDANWSHTGSLPGTNTFDERDAQDGKYCWVAFFNSRPQNDNAFDSAVQATLWNAHRGVTSIPAYDLFRPLPQSPANNAITNGSVTLQWYYPDRTNGYHLQVANDSAFSSLILDDSTINGGVPSYQLNLLSGAKYWRVKAQDSAGIGDSWSPVSKFVVPTSDVAKSNVSQLSVRQYPNPTNSFAHISYELPAVSSVRIEVVDQLGTVVYATLVDVEAAGTYSAPINVQSWPRGMYFYRVEACGGRVCGTLLIGP
ncbi:MAG: serine hydrolase [Bacteroidota bacterium]|nr:serine hydrolase [Bacteroidota bacterium]MDP4232883.1 serine hydrolase [Bacteroidota bacterium]MDP4241927.1 serine hydrolase [Bacteroidota bacterium]MDP4286830.1 serine hydrolase [Bacteroidota bacterium]